MCVATSLTAMISQLRVLGRQHWYGKILALCQLILSCRARWQVHQAYSTFPRRAKVIFRVVWHFRAGRKLFPEWFGISALGESHFLSGLAFPRMAKVVSRVVWHFRAERKLFPEWFGACANRLFINIAVR